MADNSDDRQGGDPRRFLRRGVAFVLFGLVVNHLVVPQLGGARRALHLLSDVQPLLLPVALGLQVAALVAYAQLTRSTLPREPRIALATVVRVQLATKAVSNLVPGGSAAGGTLGFRLLTEAGVEPSHAGFALASAGLGSALVLNVILWVALAISIPLTGFSPAYGTAAIVGLVFLAVLAVLILLMSRGRESADRVVRAVARKVPFVDPETASRYVHQIAARVVELRRNPAVVRHALFWAAVNWLLDAASLWVFLAAFGADGITPIELLVAFGLANVLAAIPLTPGGLGVIEAVLTSTLVGFGLDRATAAIGVVTYRLASFWLPIPLGAGAYATLRYGPRSLRRLRVRDELRAIAEEAEAGDRHVWDIGVRAASTRPRTPTSQTQPQVDVGVVEVEDGGSPSRSAVAAKAVARPAARSTTAAT